MEALKPKTTRKLSTMLKACATAMETKKGGAVDFVWERGRPGVWIEKK
jgi:hypothetical protein